MIWAVSLLSMELSPHVLTAFGVFSFGIRSLVGKTRPKAPVVPSSALPPKHPKTLALKLFRREPAITRLD